MGNYVLAIDQGTTGSTALIVDIDQRAKVLGRANVEFKQHYPKSGWVEHDLDEIWQSVLAAIKSAIAQAKSADMGFTENKIQSIGITNQRETLCVFDRKTGAAVRPAIVWQCRRSTEICQQLRQDGLSPQVTALTGLVIDPYFTGSKIRWVMENDAATASKIKSGEALIGTIDTFILYRLTGQTSFATEASNASRTLLMDIGSGSYSTELMKIFGVPSVDCLPKICDSAGVFGKTKGLSILPDGIPVSGIVGDQQAALAGQICFEEGEAKCTYGTGAFLLMNTSGKNLRSKAGLLTTVAWQYKGKLSYCFEGSAFIAGAAVQFLRDQMGFIEKASETEAMASGAIAAPEVYFVPALTGLGAPYWNAKARGGFFGLTRGTTKGQMIRAALEAIAFQVHDLLDAIESDVPGVLKVLRVDGGACENNLLMQMQSDLANLKVDRPKNLETTALGAAMFAALGVGICPDFAALRKLREDDRVFLPGEDRSDSAEMLSGWKRAVQAVELFAKF